MKNKLFQNVALIVLTLGVVIGVICMAVGMVGGVDGQTPSGDGLTSSGGEQIPGELGAGVTAWDGSVATDEDMAAVYDEDTQTYSIASGAHLAWIANKTNAAKPQTFAGVTFVMTADINLANKDFTPIGDVDAYPGKTFAGTFDGDNFTIYNLKVTATGSAHSTAALFGSAYNATIKDLKVAGATVTSDHYAGVFVGYTSNGVTIDNCKATVVSILSAPALVGGEYDNGDKVGGVIGYGVNAVVTNCVVEKATIQGYRHIGGILGYVSGTYNIDGNTVKDTIIKQDDTNGYKDEAVVATLVDEIAGNADDVTLGQNVVENVVVQNIDVA